MQPGQHRETARILLSNRLNQYLLLLTHFDPEVGLPARWITPGGGIDAGETPLDAAVRELREETGLIVAPDELGEEIWRTDGRWDWPDGNFHTYTDYFFALQVDSFEIDKSGWTADENRDVLEIRWWNAAELSETDELVGPHGLIAFLSRHF